MTYWWDGDIDERYWVEIRKLPGIGIDLECPDHQMNSDGTPGRNAWYELVHSVRRGDVVYHYNEREQRFVGRSVAAADAVHDKSNSRYVVDLEAFTPIEALVDLAYMRKRSSTLLSQRNALQAAHPESTIYTPFQFRATGLYGMMSNYFAKLPQAVVVELFGVDGLAHEVLPEARSDDSASGDDGTASFDNPASSGFLHPFRPKADTDYISKIVGGRRRRTRRHERLINDCATWLESLAHEPLRNAAIDLGLEDPLVVIEGKTIGHAWAPPVRQAVSQLYEYRYFKVASPDAGLIFLAEKEVPSAWVRYLEHDRGIGVMWRTSSGFDLSKLARQELGL